MNLNQNAFFSTSKPNLWGLAFFKLPLGSAVTCPCSQPHWQGSDLSPWTPEAGKRPGLLWPLKDEVQPTGSVQNLNPAPGRHSLSTSCPLGIYFRTYYRFWLYPPLLHTDHDNSSTNRAAPSHPLANLCPEGGDVPGRAGTVPCSPGKWCCVLLRKLRAEEEGRTC